MVNEKKFNSTTDGKQPFCIASAPFLAVPCVYGFGLFVPMSRSLLWVLLYGMSAFLAWHALKVRPGKRADIAAAVLGFAFACFTAAGKELERDGRLAFYGLIVIQLAGFALFLFFALRLLFSAVMESERLSSDGGDRTGNTDPLPPPCSLKKTVVSALLAALLIFICWLPYFVIFWPGTMSSDALGEIRQQLGMSPLTNHHPVIHQLFIKLCLILAGNSAEKGTAVYSVFQMLLLSGAFGAAEIFIRNRTVTRWPAFLTFCFFAFFPVNPLYAIMMEKGSAMAPVTLILILLLMKEMERPCLERTDNGTKENTTDKKNSCKLQILERIALVASSFLFCTLRNNGLYAFVIGMIFVILLAGKGKRKRLLVAFISSMILVFGYRFILFDVVGVPKSSSGETLSVPLQQIARVARECPEELASEEFEVFDEFFSDVEALGDLYDPVCADPVKAPAVFSSETFRDNTKKFLKCWLRLGLRHPREYLDAFLMQNYGYWYTDTDEPAVSYSIYEPNDFSLSNNKRFESARVRLMESLGRLMYRSPFAILFSIGFSFWLLVLSMVILWLRGCGKYAAPLFIVAALWLTTLASPVYCSYRYLYPMVAVPNMFFLKKR